jgi:1,4-alpha-glucan branching enzyme
VSPPAPRLAIVLHTHMPYVEGFGVWPFGEEWLWEAIATSYLPLLEVLDRHPGKVTVSLTPVLADQFEAAGNFLPFARDLRRESHAIELAAHPELRVPLEHSAARTRAPDRRLDVLRHARGAAAVRDR